MALSADDGPLELLVIREEAELGAMREGLEARGAFGFGPAVGAGGRGGGGSAGGAGEGKGEGCRGGRKEKGAYMMSRTTDTQEVLRRRMRREGDPHRLVTTFCPAPRNGFATGFSPPLPLPP